MLDFQARLQRANILFKQGSFQDAVQDYQYIVRKLLCNSLVELLLSNHSLCELEKLNNEKGNEEARTRLDKVYDVVNDLGSAKQYMESQDYSNAVNLFSKVLEVV